MSADDALTEIFRTEWSRVVATLVRELRDLELAEDVAQEAFVEASTRWAEDGVPRRPGAWLLTTARRRAIDRLRRDRRFANRLPDLVTGDTEQPDDRTIADDQLALIFGCCHPALDDEARVALTLRSVAGLSTREIARAFLVTEPTMAKRLVRAKHRIRATGIPFTVPESDRLADRLSAVCGVVYAIFTEGHRRSDGVELLRPVLCDEAIWLAETLVELLPGDPEVLGLAALVLLTDARRPARTDEDGNVVLLADQDRSLWDREKIDRGLAYLGAAHRRRRVGVYQLLASIASLHATAESHETTAWSSILSVYDVLLLRYPTPVLALNRAVAVAEVHGPDAALGAIDELAGSLDDYEYLHSTRAELLHRTGRTDEAAAAMGRAIGLSGNDSEIAWMRERIASWERIAD
ncbi:MAG: sigma-70 family RNA polymerase sigma factor [Actinomycetota bacterium]